MMDAVWPNISNTVAVETKRFMKSFIEQTLDQTRPPVVEGAFVRNITFGQAGPTIKYLQPHKLENPNQYQLDITLDYKGGLELTIAAVRLICLFLY